MLEQVRVIEDAPGVARGDAGPLVSPEVVVIAAFPLKGRGVDAQRAGARRVASRRWRSGRP